MSREDDDTKPALTPLRTALEARELQHWAAIRAIARAAGYPRAEADDFGGEAVRDGERLFERIQVLARIAKYAREDRATTPGTTRLARALAELAR